MIIIIILATAILIFLGLMFSGFFYSDSVYYYNPNGECSRDFDDLTFKNKKEEDRVRSIVIKELREKAGKDESYEPDYYAIKYYRLKASKKNKLVWSADFDNYRTGFGLGLGAVFLIALLGCGIPCIVHHGPLNQEVYATKLTVQLDDLHDRQNTIYLTLAGDLNLSVQDDGATYHVIVDKPLDMANTINEYNTDVKAFKQELYLEKCRSASPWTNWFINPGYTKVDGYNASAKTYKDILGDTLKTFELKKM